MRSNPFKGIRFRLILIVLCGKNWVIIMVKNFYNVGLTIPENFFGPIRHPKRGNLGCRPSLRKACALEVSCNQVRTSRTNTKCNRRMAAATNSPCMLPSTVYIHSLYT